MTDPTHIRGISSLDIPELQPYRILRRPQEQYQKSIFVAEGEKVVRRLLDSDIPVASVLVTEEWFEKLFHGESKRKKKTFEVFVAGDQLSQQIVGYNVHHSWG